ncbi:diacylglycerol o-acyltransferase 1 [Phtheirospermum japonicum]|uniref:diacylglycerol O-acyltransferase n=1 Tax=Phtheirospermum japonicum TaxID=374723 RepID=A0A830BGI4_9LAMI|nr:diacylglycerol o-acyltransferase 1 [Phtheirospermum japonicum]
MAILESPESLDTTSSSADNGHTTTLRRRPSARSVEPLLESDSNSLEAASAVNDAERDKNDANLAGKLRGGVVESLNEERGTESASEGMNCGKEKEDEVKENGESGNGKGVDALGIKFAYRPSAPAHRRSKESPLSSDAIFKQSHAGLFNLCIVVLVAVNSRLIIENLMKYGWLIKAGFWFGPKSLRDWPLFMCCLSLPIFPLAAFLVEKLVKQEYMPEWVAVFLHVVITTTEILYPVVVILRYFIAMNEGWKRYMLKVTKCLPTLCDSAVLSGVTLMLFACIVWLKLVSYAHTNYDLRVLAKSLDKWEALSSYWNVDYSYDVNFKSLVYFMVAPTLCYQVTYALVITTDIICKFLKKLNILAELLCFGDREFYKDWWNARTVEEPVHKWMVRHIYFPCLRNGIPKVVAVLVAFLVSAIFHELCIAVPCHMFKLWAFIAVSSSLRHCNRPWPWLILHSQSTRPPYATATHAYDPRSSAWVEIPSRPQIPYASHLKRSGKMELPEWTDIVKTGVLKGLSPYDPDWYYIRAVSMARKIYLRGGLGVGAFRRIYGRSKRNESCPPHLGKNSGSVARHIIQQLQKMSIVEVDPRGGRRITSRTNGISTKLLEVLL